MDSINMKTTLPLLAIALSVPLLLNACGGSDTSTSAQTGTLNVVMTDAPACGFDHVYVTVKQVRVHSSDSVNETAAGWLDIVLPLPLKIDLLALTNGVLLHLGQTPLPVGHYQQVRLVLDANSGANPLANAIIPTGGSEQPLDTPSAVQSGIKIIHAFTVQADSLTDLVLDFDACRSIVQRGDGSYELKPVVTATPMAVSGAITGYVHPAEAGATIYAEQNGVIIKGTVAASTGRFVLAPVLQSSGTGNYDVVIVQNNYATGVVRAVPVSAGTSTDISTLTAPIILPPSSMRVASQTLTPASSQATVYAQQLVSSNTYTTALVNANGDTGVWSLNLAAGAPLLADYSTTLPLVFTADASASGLYTLKAVTATGTTLTGW